MLIPVMFLAALADLADQKPWPVGIPAPACSAEVEFKLPGCCGAAPGCLPKPEIKIELAGCSKPCAGQVVQACATLTPAESGEVKVAAKLIACDAEGLARVRECCPGFEGRAELCDGQIERLLDCVRECAGCRVISAPEAVGQEGEKLAFSVTESNNYVTAIAPYSTGGPVQQVVFIPQVEPLRTGVEMDCVARRTPDGEAVQMHIALETRRAVDPQSLTPLFPVTTFITPVFEGGSQSQPVPFTQFIQQPTISTTGLESVVCVPAGKSVLFEGGSLCSHKAVDEKTPVLGSMPCVGKLFTSRRWEKVNEHLLVLVTPRVTVSHNAEKACGGCESKKPCDD